MNSENNLSPRIDSDTIQHWADIDTETLDFDEIANELQANLELQILESLELEHAKEIIGNPNALGQTVLQVVWEQFINQIGVVAGEDFIRENKGLTLDLRDDAHIQTTENFKKGKFSTHNHEIDYKKRYDDWQECFEKNDDGSIKTRFDRRANRDVEVVKKSARNYIDDGRPAGTMAIHKDHTISAAEIIRDPQAAAHLSREEHNCFANSPDNLLDLDGRANESKKDLSMSDWLNSERDGKKPAERFDINEKELQERDQKAREKYSDLKETGEQRSIEVGKQSQKSEAFRITGKALRAAIMGLLASFIKDVIRQLIVWIRAGKRKFSSFIDCIKKSFKNFFSNLKSHILNVGNTILTSIATAILGPVVGMIKKAWIFLKQGWSSLKNAINYIKDPANKNKPFSILVLEVGKIIIAGITAGGAIVMSELIEKGLMAIPIFAFEIPMLGSLANLLGIFLGALVSGIIGALALNLIDQMVAKQQILNNQRQLIESNNKILAIQGTLIDVKQTQCESTRAHTIASTQERHTEFANRMQKSIEHIVQNAKTIDAQEHDASFSENISENNELLDQIIVKLQMN